MVTALTRPVLKIEGRTIVLVGSFNPAIFQPAWFGNNNLLRAEEVSAAADDQLIVTRQVVRFHAGGFDIAVTEDRFTVASSDAALFIPLRDLVVGTFRLLEHTPINQLGMNRHTHYLMPSQEDYRDFGHFLVPKAPWSEIVDDPGVQSLKITSKRREGDGTRFNIKVEPSSRVPFGVFFDTNDHYERSGPDGSREIIDLVEKNWSSTNEFSSKVEQSLIEQFYASRRG